MPWMMNVVSLSMRIDIGIRRLHLRDGAAGGLVHRDGAVAVLDAVLASRILKPSSSHAPGMRKIAIVSAGSRPDSTQPLMTPRATMSTRVFETTFIMTAIFFTPGFERMSLVSSHAFLHARVAADLAVVGGLAAVLADGVEERERAAAGADHEAEVAVELLHVAGDAAVIGRRRPRRPRSRTAVGGRASRVSSLPMPSSCEQLGVLVARVALHVDVAVEDEEACRPRACRAG